MYVMLKILKLLLSTTSKITSYNLKFAVNQALNTTRPTIDELSFCIEKVLYYKTLRDKILFDTVTPRLKTIAIRKEGMEFVGETNL